MNNNKKTTQKVKFNFLELNENIRGQRHIFKNEKKTAQKSAF